VKFRFVVDVSLQADFTKSSIFMMQLRVDLHSHRALWYTLTCGLLFRLFSFLGRLVHERFVDVRDDTATGDGGLDKGVQLFVTSNRKLQVSRGNTFHLC